MYRMDAVLSLILLVFEMLKIPKTKSEAHFLRNFIYQQMFGARYLRRMSKDNRKPFKIHSITAFTSYSYYLVYSTKPFQ